jgi:predicted metalloprotease
MRWEDGRRSENVEDVRGTRAGLGGGGLKLGGGGILLLLLAAWLFGADPLALLQQLDGGGGSAQIPDRGYTQEFDPSAPGAAKDPLSDFVSVVLADTEDTWGQIFADGGSRYEPPRLVLFTDAVRSGCGVGQTAMGPFYCPVDQKVYIDLGFYRELRERFHAPGDFAQAYVIAHEVGHHVQNQLGIAEKVSAQRQRMSEAQSNALSVRMELQADCLAGVWAHNANRSRKILEEGDVEEGLRAAASIGDDRIQRQTQGTVVPESWTHGSSEQRVRWFKRGLEAGALSACDTFAARAL